MLTSAPFQGEQDAVPGYGCKTPPTRLVLLPWFPNWPPTKRASWSGVCLTSATGYELAGQLGPSGKGNRLGSGPTNELAFAPRAPPLDIPFPIRARGRIGLKGPPGADERSARPYVLAHLLIILLLEPLVDGVEDSPRWAEGLSLAA